MSNLDYTASVSTPRNLTAKQARTLWDLFSYTTGLWNDGLAITIDAKEQTGYYPTYETIYSVVKRFPEYKLLGSDISQTILKNTLNIAMENHIKTLKGETEMNYELPHWKRRTSPLPLMTTVRESYLDRVNRIFTLPMSRKMASILKAEAKKKYDSAEKTVKTRKKAKSDDEYLDKAIKHWRKVHPKDKIHTSKLRKKLKRELEEAILITSVKRKEYTCAYIDERRVHFDIPESVDMDLLAMVSVTQHRHGSYVRVRWIVKTDKQALPSAPEELPQAIRPTPSVDKTISQIMEKRQALPECKRVDATIDLNVKNLIACSLLEIKDEKLADDTMIEVAKPFYSFVMDGGWLLSSCRLTEKSLSKINAEHDSWKNLRGDASWEKKKQGIVERTEGKKNPSRRRRQRHLNALRDKRTEQYARGKMRSDTIIDIIVKNTVVLLGAAGASRVCIGHTIGQKQSSSLKQKSAPSQNFQKINYTRVRKRLEHWCAVFGWDYVESEESYTSKVSAYDMEELPCWNGSHHPEYKFVGKRVCRGLFRCADGTIVNADVNGALNIWRKCSPDGRLERAEGLAGVYHPCRVSVEASRS